MSAAVFAQNATVTVHADQGKQKIYKEIYGQFAEHLGSCIYGGPVSYTHLRAHET